MDSLSNMFDKLKALFGATPAAPEAPNAAPNADPNTPAHHRPPPQSSAPLITALHLEQIYNCPRDVAERWVMPIDATLRRYAITTPARIAAFLAQIGHESERLAHVREVWGPTNAQARYEGRADLGNLTPGDGFRYRGRGLIQITGRHNYRAVAEALGVDCINHPELLEVPALAALTAGWYWNSRHLNDLADAGLFDEITRRINGGQNGRPDRQALHARALRVLL